METVSRSARTREPRDSTDFAGTTRPAGSLLSYNVDDSLGGFGLPVTLGTDVIIPRKPFFFFSNIFP